MENLPDTVFHFDEGKTGFEDLGKPNGVTHWDQEILRNALGYESPQAFAKAMNKAQAACLTLGIECRDHFVLQDDGTFALTRFGCYLVAMNGDSRKPEVAAAQAWFAAIATTFQSQLEHAEAVERIVVREDLKDSERALVSTAKSHGVDNYAFFHNAGYLGMYNMSLRQLRAHKGLQGTGSLLDRMGRAELAANLFRITQTEQKIAKDGIRGQRQLENTARSVGKAVRDTMERVSGSKPEDLPLADGIGQVRKKLKVTRKQLEDGHRPESQD